MDFMEERIDTELLVDRVVEFKGQRREIAHHDLFRGGNRDKSRSGLEGFYRSLFFRWSADDANVDLCMLQIVGNIDRGHAHKMMDMRIFDLSMNDLREDLL